MARINITITLKDGTQRKFQHEDRPGGSYTNEIRFEPGFVVVTDAWGVQKAISSDTIAEIYICDRDNR